VSNVPYVVKALLITVAASALVAAAPQRGAAPAQRWVAAWAASVHGPYPSGNPSAQPDLQLVFPAPAEGAVDQTFRLIVKPDVWGPRTRVRLSNAFGTRAVTFDHVTVGVHDAGGRVIVRTLVPATFAGKAAVAVEPGATVTSDPIALRFVTPESVLTGRKLAVSVHVAGPTGPMTWHAKALTTSYVTAPHGGDHAADVSETAFPFTTTSWFFLDALDMEMPTATSLVACFGDSITDGTASTLNGDDRWPDVLSRRAHEKYGSRVSIVNAGIGGNQVVGPKTYAAASPVSGGPSAVDRFDRDVLSLAGLKTIVWLEGINDLGAGTSAEDVIAGMKTIVSRAHARGVRVIGATITSSLGSTTATHASADVDARRKAVNAFIRTGGVFDGVADFDAATVDPATGGLRAMFQPNSTTGGAGDRLHPNRAGYLAMGNAIDLDMLLSTRAFH